MTTTVPRYLNNLARLGGHAAAATAVAFSPDGRFLASGSHDATVIVWDFSRRQQIQRLEPHGGAVNALAFSPDGQVLAVVCMAGFSAYDLDSWQMTHRCGEPAPAYSIAFSPTEHWVLVGNAAGQLSYWSLGRRWVRERQIAVGNSLLTSISLSPDGSVATATSQDGSLTIVSARTWKIERTIGSVAPSRTTSHKCAFSADGSSYAWSYTLLGAGLIPTVNGAPHRSEIVVGQAHNGELNGRSILAGHLAPAFALSFSAQSPLLASGSHDTRIKLWHYPDARLIAQGIGHTDTVYDVAFSPDGEHLASASGDKTVLIWSTNIASAAHLNPNWDSGDAVIRMLQSIAVGRNPYVDEADRFLDFAVASAKEQVAEASRAFVGLDPSVELRVAVDQILAVRRLEAQREGNSWLLDRFDWIARLFHGERPDERIGSKHTSHDSDGEESDAIEDAIARFREHGQEPSELGEYLLAAESQVKSITDGGRKVKSLTAIAEGYEQIRSFEAALRVAQQALKIQEQMGDIVGQASSQISCYRALDHLFRFDEADHHARLAETLAERTGNKRLSAESKNALGNLARSRGQTADALANYKEASVLYRELGDLGSGGVAAYNLGALHESLGQARSALGYLTDAVNLLALAGDKRAEGIAEAELAMVIRDLGHPSDALGHLFHAMGLATMTHDFNLLGMVANNLGRVYRSAGLLEESYEQLQRARDIATHLGDLHSIGAAYNNLGLTCLRMSDWTSALEYLQDAAAIARQLKMAAPQLSALVNKGFVEAELEMGKHCANTAKDALALAKSLGDRRGTTRAQILMGISAALQGKADKAVAVLTDAVAGADETGLEPDRISALFERGNAWRILGRRKEAVDDYRAAFELMELLSNTAPSDDTSAGLFATFARIPAEYIRLLIETGNGASAFEIAQRSKARSLVNLLVDAQTKTKFVEPSLQQDLRETLEELQSLSDKRQMLLSINAEAGQITEVTSQKQAVELKRRWIESEIRQRNPRLSETVMPPPWDVARVQGELLDERTALLEYVLGEPEGVAFVLTKEKFATFRLPGRNQLSDMVTQLRSAVTHRLPSYPHGHRLYQALVEPALEAIEDRDLLIAPDGALHLLPFAILQTRPDMNEAGTASEHYLIRDRAISYTASGTAAGLARREAGRVRQFEGTFAGYADPVLTVQPTPANGDGPAARLDMIHGEFPRVPETANEIWSIAEVFGTRADVRGQSYDGGGVRLRTGHAATKADVAALITTNASYRYWHFATHGLLNTENPQLSGLVFSSQSGLADEALWRSFEIFNAHLPCDLVTLSACETGLGKAIPFEGLVGLIRAFLYAGAPSVIVSLWKVADNTAPPLMKALYQELIHGSLKRDALRKAQLSMIEPGHHPFHWASFILTGDYR